VVRIPNCGTSHNTGTEREIDGCITFRTPPVVGQAVIMTDILIETTSEDGYASRSIVGDFELKLDGDGEDGPRTTPTLVATYAGCWIPAFRAAAKEWDVEDLGRVEIDSEADLDDDGDLEAIRFKVKAEAALGEDKDEIVEQAHEFCHVDAALRDDLRADVVVEDDVF